MSAIINPGLPTAWVEGLHLALGLDPDNDVDANPGGARDETDVIDLISAGALGFALDAANGIGGLDTGAAAINSWYALYLAGKSDGTVGLLGSLEPTYAGIIGAGDNPAGYDWGRRIGYLLTRNDAAELLPFEEENDSDHGRTRWIYWAIDGDADGPVPFDSLLVDEGTATSFTACPLHGGGALRIAPSAVNCQLAFETQRFSSSSGFSCQVRPSGSGVDNVFEVITGFAATNDGNGFDTIARVPVNAARTYDYRLNTNAGNCTIHVVGYEDAL